MCGTHKMLAHNVIVSVTIVHVIKTFARGLYVGPDVLVKRKIQILLLDHGNFVLVNYIGQAISTFCKNFIIRVWTPLFTCENMQLRVIALSLYL